MALHPVLASLKQRWLTPRGNLEFQPRHALLAVMPLLVFLGSESALNRLTISPEMKEAGAYSRIGQAVAQIDMIAATTLLVCVCVGIVIFFVCECSARLTQ